MAQKTHLPTLLEEVPQRYEASTYHAFPGTLIFLSTQSIPAHTS